MSRKQAKTHRESQLPRESQKSQGWEVKPASDKTPIENKDSKEIPEELNDIEFDLKFRGYNCAQVDHYLNALTEDYNAICRECDNLKQENQGLRKALAALGEVKSGAAI